MYKDMGLPAEQTHHLLLPASRQPKRDTGRRRLAGQAPARAGLPGLTILTRYLSPLAWGAVREGRARLGTRYLSPSRLWLGPVWTRLGSVTRRELGAGVTVTRLLASQPTRPSPRSRSPDGTRSRGNNKAVSHWQSERSAHSPEPTVTLSGFDGQANRSAARILSRRNGD